MSYKHIIWDWNGTLLNDIDLAVYSMNLILEDEKMEGISRENYLNDFGFPVSEYYKQIGFDFDKLSSEEISNTFVANYRNHWDMTGLHEGVEDTLKDIANSGKTQSILSAAEQETLYEIVSHFRIRNYFTDLIGLDNHEAKSKVERGQAWIKDQHIDIEKTIMIGDTIHDLEVAKTLGCHCSLVAHGHQSYERLIKYDVPVFKNIEELRKVILK